jgi:hypothetical protein
MCVCDPTQIYVPLLNTGKANASSMQAQSEELSRLRVEYECMKQLLASKDAQMTNAAASTAALLAGKDELLATKEQLLLVQDELLASRTAELQRCTEILERRAATASRAVTDSDIQERLSYSRTVESPLDRDDILDHVLSYVGGGDHLYVGGVSRRLRGEYMQYCVQEDSASIYGKLVTRHRSAVTTQSRLQLALGSGLTVAGWTFSKVPQAWLIYMHSLEPEKVMTLLRVHGAPWSTMLCDGAARYNKLALLQWLFMHSCPWEADRLLRYASRHGSIAMLGWLLTVTPTWSPDAMRYMLGLAACNNTLAAVQWLRGQGAIWPYAFSYQSSNTLCKCWSLSAVKWALSCGSGWLEWKCEDYAADKYALARHKQQAKELLEWAHANGCPCTCEHAQQQQQQQQ